MFKIHQSSTFTMRLLFALILMLTLAAALPQKAQAGGAPVLAIVSVSTDQSVTVKMTNLPANVPFTVRMGTYGSYGIGGYSVGTFNSGSGGTLQATYSIPAALKGSQKIAIRIDGTLGYYAYNWFTNTTASPGPTPTPQPSIPGYSGYPTFSIVSVANDTSVTIKTKNLPPSQTFTVRMGAYGTYGKGGPEVGTLDSSAGAVQELTYNIPAALKGSGRIAIRMDSSQGYYAYNWFYNTSTSITATPAATPAATPVGPAYSGYPTFSIKTVVHDATVTVNIKNLPPNQTFTVRMGAYGTYGLGGTQITSFDSGPGGAKELTFTIPDGLKGSTKIAIRMDSNFGYYAYNWFYNTTN